MSTTHLSAEPAATDTATVDTTTGATVDAAGDDRHRFRAPTIDQALAAARAQLGDVEIVQANRIRRGGVGGFFATDLGVELEVRPAGSHRSGPSHVDAHTRAADGLAAIRDLVDDEYLDSARPDTGRGDATGRVPADGSLTAEIERLLSVAAAAERRAVAPVAPEAPEGPRRPTGTRSFAEHLAAHLGDTPAEPAGRLGHPERVETLDPRPLPPTDDDLDDLVRRRRTPIEAVRALTAPDRELESPEETVERLLRQIVGAGDAPVGTTAETPADTPAETPVETPVDVPAESATARPLTARATPRSASRTTRARARTARQDAAEPAATTSTRTPTPRDPWRRSVDLAAAAVGRLVEQLADVAPAEGSRMQSLSRLTVSVTTPDGAVIELTAELEGDA